MKHLNIEKGRTGQSTKLESQFVQLRCKRKTILTGLIAFMVFAGILWFFKDNQPGKTFFMISCLSVSYYAFHNRNQEIWNQYSGGILIGISLFLFGFLVIQTIQAAVSDKQWDFMCFYMQGLLGVHHLDFYNPDSFRIILEKLNFQYTFSEEFKSEIFNVGFLSPPITMLLYAPIASLDYKTSRIILSILIFLFIIINAIVANKLFYKNERSFYSFLFIFIVIVLIPGTNHTIFCNQTTFFILFFIFLFMQNIDKPRAGIYLALSLIFKPITGFLILFFLLNKNWKAVYYFLLTVTVLFIITGFLWGFDEILNFFKSPPTLRMPESSYIETSNHSLIGIINRNLKDYNLPKNVINLLFYLMAGSMTFITMVASKKQLVTNTFLSFLPFLACMLMIYPSSQGAYMVMLIPLVLYISLQRHGEQYFWMILIPALAFARTEMFFTYLIPWIALVVIVLFSIVTNRANQSLNLDFNTLDEK